ncbi:hypothetical protein K523DRAFT_322830 [Schizophyllum commune Tattone D]|nr:hypothetical protein K523DRAFT_322830 [Schizophyllum commune Tattone D]
MCRVGHIALLKDFLHPLRTFSSTSASQLRVTLGIFTSKYPRDGPTTNKATVLAGNRAVRTKNALTALP